jgi:hypothetical protein
MERKKKIAIIFILILLICIISVYYIYDNPKWEEEIFYSVEITQNNESQYILQIPIIWISNEGCERVFNKIKIIDGSGDLQLINASLETALEIRSSSKYLKLESKLNLYKGLGLTLGNLSTENLKIYNVYYCSPKNETISLKITVIGNDEKGGGIEYITKPAYQEISNGWNKIYMTSCSGDR